MNLPTFLARPCLQDSYSTAIAVTGGVGPYRWVVNRTAGNWESVKLAPNPVDSSRATLTAEPAGDAELKITVSDNAGHVLPQVYAVSPRSSCYFAYVAPGQNGPKLALQDPLLGIDATNKLTNNQGVSDFQFSPNGRALAYRYGETAPNSTGAHLSVLDLTTMQDHALVFEEDAVTAYAWSPDSAVLAVAFTAGGESKLGGSRFTLAAAGLQISPLEAVVPDYPVQSKFLWLNPTLVTFFSKADGNLGVSSKSSFSYSSAFYAALGNGTFEMPVPIYGILYRPGFEARAAPGGLFVTSPEVQKSYYSPVDVDQEISPFDHGINFVDPAGRFTANDAEKTLRLFQADAASVVVHSSSSDPEVNCPKLLTWARDKERIACVADVSKPGLSYGELRIFDLSSPSRVELASAILPGACLKDAQGGPLGPCSQAGYDYGELTARAQPRLLSASGDWLAFVTGANSGAPGLLYWADLAGSSLKLARKVGTRSMGAGVPVVLAFSPSERFLVHQNGSQLIAHLLSAGPQAGGDLELALSGVSAPSTVPCADDYVSGGPSGWCGGGASGRPSFVWSPDSSSDVLAFRKSDQLLVVSLSATTAEDYAPLSAPLCDATCSGQYAFQPAIP